MKALSCHGLIGTALLCPDMECDPAPPIQSGTPEKTGWLVEWMMKSMYDADVNPLIEKLEKTKAAAASK
jgi:hypothetical protein